MSTVIDWHMTDERIKEVFKALMEQGPSWENGQCRYRTSDGKKCAVGMVLPDSCYNPDDEGEYVGSLKFALVERGATVGCSDDDLKLLGKMQNAHDTAARRSVKGRDFKLDLVGMWKYHNLPLPDEFQST